MSKLMDQTENYKINLMFLKFLKFSILKAIKFILKEVIKSKSKNRHQN